MNFIITIVRKINIMAFEQDNIVSKSVEEQSDMEMKNKLELLQKKAYEM
jgi:hypothetical protein